MKIENDDDRLILIAAFRYALGRMTYMPGVVVSVLKQNWKDLESSDRALIQREIKDAIREDRAGWECDKDTWKRLLELEV